MFVVLLYVVGVLYLALLVFSWVYVVACEGKTDVHKTTLSRVLFWHGLVTATVLVTFIVWMLAATAGNLLAISAVRSF